MHRINDSYYPDDEIEAVGSVILKDGLRKRTFAGDGETDTKQI